MTWVVSTTEDEEPTGSATVSFQLNTGNKSEFLKLCRSIRLTLSIHLSNGVTLTNRVKIPVGDSGGDIKIQSIFGHTLLWATSFTIIVLTVLFIMRWGANHDLVYRAININVEMILIVGTAILVYLGIPSSDNLSSLRREGILSKLKSYLSYPEYYFDPWIVRIVRHWLSLVLLVVLTVLINSLYGNYKTYDFKANVPPDDMYLVSKFIPESKAYKIDEACKSSSYVTNSQASDYKWWSASANFKYLSNLVRTHWSAESASNPKRIYERDIDETCVAFKPQSPTNMPPICVADLKKDGNQVDMQWHTFEAPDAVKTFLNVNRQSLKQEELKDSEDHIKALHYFRGLYQDDWHVFLNRKAGNCGRIEIA